jgi:hypothetical protein
MGPMLFGFPAGSHERPQGKIWTEAGVEDVGQRLLAEVVRSC